MGTTTYCGIWNQLWEWHLLLSLVFFHFAPQPPTTSTNQPDLWCTSLQWFPIQAKVFLLQHTYSCP